MDESEEVLDGLRYLFKEEWLELLIRLFNLLNVALCDEIHLLTWWQLWLSGPSLLRSVGKFRSLFFIGTVFHDVFFTFAPLMCSV